MRTTFNMEPDVANLVRRARKERSETMKRILNDALRRGLGAPKPLPKKPYRMKSSSCGKPLIDLSNIGEALAILEGEDYR